MYLARSQTILSSTLCKKCYIAFSSQAPQFWQLPAGDVFKGFYKEIIPQDALLDLNYH